MNEAAQDPLVERITIDGQQYLRYLPAGGCCLLKGSTADEDGNISLEEEPANWTSMQWRLRHTIPEAR